MIRISGRARPEVERGKQFSNASYLHVPARSPTFLVGGRLLAANPPAVMALLSLGSKYESILLQLMNDPIGIYDDDRTS